MILIAKPSVRRTPAGRWRVRAEHRYGVHKETWSTRLAAMNCALAIARTSRWDVDVRNRMNCDGTPNRQTLDVNLQQGAWQRKAL